MKRLLGYRSDTPLWGDNLISTQGKYLVHFWGGLPVLGDPEGVWLKFNRLSWGCIQAPCWNNSPKLTF